NGIPIVWYHTEGHPDYHRPSDVADKIDYEKMVDITRAAFLCTWRLAN
ncbi:MAG: M28 family peptidase, partial [Bacteroidaceae bacterium]|nr:M28 family peptidase [Bacteroidaceae bacterium]